jgi:hypothetical protein
MKEKYVKLWLDALRSGEYTQTTDRLRDAHGGFCCLGVLCDVVKKADNLEEDWELDIGSRSFYFFNEFQVLPQKIQEITGMEDAGGQICFEDSSSIVLTELNDSGSSFKEIADIIEKYWEDL